MSLRENLIKFKMVNIFFLHQDFLSSLYWGKQMKFIWTTEFRWRAATFFLPLFFFPFYKPSCYVLNVSKQLQNRFNSEYKMFWETFRSSEMVTKKFTSIRKANEKYSRAHSHPWQNCLLCVIQKRFIKKANTTTYKEREL